PRVAEGDRDELRIPRILRDGGDRGIARGNALEGDGAAETEGVGGAGGDTGVVLHLEHDRVALADDVSVAEGCAVVQHLCGDARSRSGGGGGDEHGGKQGEHGGREGRDGDAGAVPWRTARRGGGHGGGSSQHRRAGARGATSGTDRGTRRRTRHLRKDPPARNVTRNRGTRSRGDSAARG